MKNILSPNRRILVVDDNPAIHGDFRRVLQRDDTKLKDLDAEAAALFGAGEMLDDTSEEIEFSVDAAHQGKEALEMVKEALEAGKPYALAFIDMRMPPGWDGLQTIEEIWKIDDSIQVVICTAYSDRSWKEIQQRLDQRDRWMVVKKPFDQIEVLQLAHALTKKWDMTKEAQIRQSALEQMVEARTEQLTAALQTNSDFLDHVSHEMLTPMNGILGLLDLLNESDLEHEDKETVAETKQCAENLLRLLNQVLAYNEAGSKEIKPANTTVVLNEWLPKIINEKLRKSAAEKELALSTNIDSEVPKETHIPANIVQRVLAILVENAIKFTKSGSINICVRQSNHHPSALCFEVSDTGIGLKAEELQLLQIPFAQVDGSLARTNDGIGIGLPLTRRLLNLIGAELEIKSLPGEGTSISFTIEQADCRIAI